MTLGTYLAKQIYSDFIKIINFSIAFHFEKCLNGISVHGVESDLRRKTRIRKCICPSPQLSIGNKL